MMVRGLMSFNMDWYIIISLQSFMRGGGAEVLRFAVLAILSAVYVRFAVLAILNAVLNAVYGFTKNTCGLRFWQLITGAEYGFMRMIIKLRETES